jgi:hypothetical protein
MDHPAEGDINHEKIILELERPVERTVLIKRKGAPSQRRYVVMMDFCISGTGHETQFSLTDRGNFSYPLLLGRRFMRDDNILIDSADSFIAANEYDYKWALKNWLSSIRRKSSQPMKQPDRFYKSRALFMKFRNL